jgi:hypothetical protein
MIRDDLSTTLIHLTRDESEDPDESLRTAEGRLVSIAKQKKLLGGTTFIKGSYRCICFTEAPISKLSHILASGPRADLRYAPFGVMVDKTWLFQRGVSPLSTGPTRTSTSFRRRCGTAMFDLSSAHVAPLITLGNVSGVFALTNCLSIRPG